MGINGRNVVEQRGGGSCEWMTEGGMGRELLRFDPLSRGRGTWGLRDERGSGLLADWNRRRMARDVVDGRAIVAPKSASAGCVVML